MSIFANIPPSALPGISPSRTGQSPMEFDVAVLPFSPAGRRWPEGSDEGVALTGRLRLRHPPHPPAGTFSPRGRRGWGNGFPPYAITVLLVGEMPGRAKGGERHPEAVQ